VNTLREILDFARHALRAERLTPAGVLNLVGLLAALGITLSIGILDLFQALVRIFVRDYSAGLPTLEVMFLLYILCMTLCVVIVGLLTRRS